MLAMSFLTANFKWILLAVVLFAMLIVGYVADKTDFGHKKTSKKEIENPNKVEELDLDNLKGKTLSDMVGGSKEERASDINEDLNAPFGDTVNTNEDINNMDALYAPIGEDLNAPLSDVTTEPAVVEDLNAPIEAPIETVDMPTEPEEVNNNIFAPIGENVEAPVETIDNTQEEVNNEVFGNDIFAPVGEENIEKPVEDANLVEEPKDEEIKVDELIPEIPVENIPENEEEAIPSDISEPITEPSVESDEVVIPASEGMEVPADTPVETIDIPLEPPVEPVEIVSEVTEETEEKPKKKKNKKAKEKNVSNKEEMDYEEEKVPEVITEKFDDGNNTEISTEDDIWKF